jgi:hypothetical protein
VPVAQTITIEVPMPNSRHLMPLLALAGLAFAIVAPMGAVHAADPGDPGQYKKGPPPQGKQAPVQARPAPQPQARTLPQPQRSAPAARAPAAVPPGGPRYASPPSGEPRRYESRRDEGRSYRRGAGVAAVIIGSTLAYRYFRGPNRDSLYDRCDRDFPDFDYDTGTFINEDGDRELCPYLAPYLD